jgi:hypothetical protein
MISSRCLDKIRTANGNSVDVSVLRVHTKGIIEAFQLFERDTFECWVHEDEPTMDGWMSDCMTVRQDVNGNVRPVKPNRMKSSNRIEVL